MAAFPAMQTTVNKYKDDKLVSFLFIDTWENSKNYPTLVSNFVDKSGYSFHVLLDDKDHSGKQTLAANAFKVTGIPTQFIIDGKGNIRFRNIGYPGSTSDLVDHISMMIDLATGR
jgi:hypothetical protein